MSRHILLLFLVTADFYTIQFTHYYKRDILPPKHIKIARFDKTKEGNVYIYRILGIAIDRASFSNEAKTNDYLHNQTVQRMRGESTDPPQYTTI